MSAHQARLITDLDAARIEQLGGHRLPGGATGLAALRDLLATVANEAGIVPGREIPRGVVTVNSIVSFLDLLTRNVQKVTVVYPADVSIPQRRVSVLSPLGRALIGRSLGHTATVEQPDGSLREIRVLRIHYQPEAEGEFTR